MEGLLTNRSLNYGMLTVLDQYNREVITWKHLLYVGVFVAQFIHLTLYILMAHGETKRIEKQAKQVLSSLQQARIDTLRFLYVGSAVVAALCSVFVLYLFLTTMWKRNMDYLYVLPMLLLVFGLAYRAMASPQSVIGFLDDTKKATKYARSGLSDVTRKESLIKLDKLMSADRVYRDNELRLAQLASVMKITSHHLSQIINEEKKQNFFDFVNVYRVREAEELISAEEGKTLLQIGYEVGFNNKNSFTSAFKKHTGMTPSTFKKSIKSQEN